jgi:GTP-binding protein
VIQLVDARHEPTKLDVQMYDYLRHYGLDGIVVATKADKISKRELQKNISVIRKTLGLSGDDKVIPISALKRTGQEELMEEIEKILEG